MKDVKFQAHVIHYLLLREVSQFRSNKICFNVSGFILKFPVSEFTVLISLKYSSDFKRKNIGESMKNTLVDKYFNGSSKIKSKLLKNIFISQGRL